MRGKSKSRKPINLLSRRTKAPAIPPVFIKEEIKRTADCEITTYTKLANKKLHNDEGPAEIHKFKDGSIKKSYYQNGKLDRVDGPAVIFKSFDQSKVEHYYENDKLHRMHGPAVVSYDKEGRLKQEEWFYEGKANSKVGPSLRIYNDEGMITTEKWHDEQISHREDGPAVIQNFPDYKVASYYKKGELHREDGPANVLELVTDETGRETYEEEWFYEGKSHRTDGPAYLKKVNNEIVHEEYLQNGMHHNENGPAIKDFEDGNNTILYAIEDEWLSEEEWTKEIEEVHKTR